MGYIRVWLRKVIEVKVIICTILIGVGVLQIVIQDKVLDPLLFGALRFLLVLHGYSEVRIRG